LLEILYSNGNLSSSRKTTQESKDLKQVIHVEPSGVQALKNPNPLKDDEGWLCLLLLCCLLDRIWGRFNMQSTFD